MIGWRIIMTVFSFKSYEIATGLAWQRCRNRGKNGDCDHFVPSKVSQSCYFETLNVVAIGALEGALGGGEEVGEGVAADGGADGACQSFEDALNLVVLVGAASRDVEIHSRRVA